MGPESSVEDGERVVGSEPIAHGGNLSRARTLFPQAPEPWIDLSTGISPYSYPHSPIPGNVFARLPEPVLAQELKAIAAIAYGGPSAAHVAAAPGTQILLPIIASLLARPGKAAVLSPTYAEHARAARLAGFQVGETGDLKQLAPADLAVVVNPNNPTGRIVAKTDLLALAALMRKKGGLLVVDEAFMDVSEAQSMAGAVEQGGLIVLRSFGKFYGMAGLRLGFALAHPSLVSRMEDRLGPWAVSGPALHVASEALADDAWRRATQARLKLNAARLDALLARAGFSVFGGTSLFRMVRSDKAQSLFRHLGESGILTRVFAERPGDLRLGLPAPADWPRVDQAFASIEPAN